MIRKIAIIAICLLVGAGISYGVTYAVQISDLRSDIESYKSQVSNLSSDIESYKSQVSGLRSELARLVWTIQLMTDLQKDQTDEQQYVPGLYEDEHFAKDLEDNLEELGYRVGYLVVFQYGSTLQWEMLVKVYYSNTFAVLVNPQTDWIVTRDYDSNSDGVVDTLLNPEVSEVSSRWDTLVATGMGNDGKYLLLEFDDYDEVQLVQYVPPGQSQESTYESEYKKLKSVLAEDKTDETPYKSEEEYGKNNYDCDNYAEDLEKALEKKGYKVSIKIIWYFDWVWHQPEAVCHEGVWMWPEGEYKWEIVGHCIVNVHLAYYLISSAGTEFHRESVAIDPQNGPCTEDVTITYDDNKNRIIDSTENPPKNPPELREQIDYGSFFERSGWKKDKDGKPELDKDGKPIPQQGTGTDGKYYIQEYDDFKDIPFPVDPGELSPKEQDKQPK